MKKLSTYLFLILFSFQTPSLADDISDFQIEGMSIGDSLLNYTTKNKIETEKKHLYKNKEYSSFILKKPSFETFDAIQIHIEDNDEKFIIEGLEGMIFLPNKIKECKKKKKEVVKDLTDFFKNSYIKEDNANHPYDETGKSKVYRTSFLVNPNDKYLSIEVACFDWSNDLPFYDKLTVNIKSDKLNDWLAVLY